MLHKLISKRFVMGLSALALAVLLFAVGSATDSRAATAPSLGDAASYGVLAGSTVTNTGPTVVNGDVGVSPGSAVVGFLPGIVVPPGTIHAADAHAGLAQASNTTAYNTLAGEPCDFDLTGQDLGGLTLTTGVYCFSTSAQLTGLLQLDMQGDPGAVFIFQIGSTLTTASNSTVLVINGGAVACNAFWQVGSSATLGTNTTFLGNVLALASITLNTGADISGRALAQTGAVTLDTNVITPSVCAVPTDTPSPSPTVVPTVPPTLAPTPTPIGQTPAPTPVGQTPSPTPIAPTPTPVGQTPSPTPIAPTPTPIAPTPSPFVPTPSPFGPTPSPTPFVNTPSPSPFVPTPSSSPNLPPPAPTISPSPTPDVPSTPDVPLLPPPGTTNTPSPTPALPNFPNTGGPPSDGGSGLPWIVVLGLTLSCLGAAVWVMSQRGRTEGQHVDRN